MIDLRFFMVLDCKMTVESVEEILSSLLLIDDEALVGKFVSKSDIDKTYKLKISLCLMGKLLAKRTLMFQHYR